MPNTGGSGFALGVWLLCKLRQDAPGTSRQKNAMPGRNKPGRKPIELVFTL